MLAVEGGRREGIWRSYFHFMQLHLSIQPCLNRRLDLLRNAFLFKFSKIPGPIPTKEQDLFLHRIVRCNATLANQCSLKSRPAFIEWHTRGEPHPLKAKIILSAGLFATVYFNWKGVLIVDFLHNCQTVNTSY